MLSLCHSPELSVDEVRKCLRGPPALRRFVILDTVGRPRRPLSVVCLALASCLLLTPAAEGAPVIAAAGDIAHGGTPSRPQRRTARLVRSIDPKVVLALGDEQYPEGALDDFRSSYDPTWGRFKAITRPVPGNHEYLTGGADGYFDYFGRRAHRRRGGYYSFNVGTWHLVAVNSGRGEISDEQLAWVRRDLGRNDARCDLAFWHHPRWSSAGSGSDGDMAALWQVLSQQGVDVVLNGHHHVYERFAPLSPTGRVRPRRGMREFVVGTGGAELGNFGHAIRGSQKRITTFGVLRLRLRRGGYRWAFVATNGNVRDRGRHGCHV